MLYFITVYILGYLVSLGLYYHNNKAKEYETDKTDLDLALFLSVFSWFTVLFLLCSTASGSDWFWRFNKKFKGE